MQSYLDILLTVIPFIIWMYLLFFYANNNFKFNNLFWKSNIILENQKYKLLKNNKKISICFIIPARNEQKYLSKTIKSILSQNFKKFVLIINDNSTDATVQISLETFRKAKFSQFKIINGKKLPNKWTGKVWALKQGVTWAVQKNFLTFFL